VTEAILSVEGLSVNYGHIEAVRDVSFSLRAGGITTLVGANGAGKSTLLGLLGARVHPTGGTVEVLGRRLGRVDLRELRAEVGHVDPRHPLGAPLRVRDVVLTGLTNSVAPLPRWHPTDEQRDRAGRLIATLGLAGLADARWPTLSQGQRGRTLIARALMPQPRLLLLDEPATGLDLPGREQLIDALGELRREHPALATVLVTHHLEELPPGTTHALLLREGRVLARGPASHVLTGDQVGKCFDLPLVLERHDGRWTVRLRGRDRGRA